jgi:hypothetical protein
MVDIIETIKRSIHTAFINPVRFTNRAIKIFANPVIIFPYTVRRRDSVIKYIAGNLQRLI